LRQAHAEEARGHVKNIDWKTVAICLALIGGEHVLSRTDALGDTVTKAEVASMIEAADDVGDEVKACLRR
jgi:hypothetical protein